MMIISENVNVTQTRVPISSRIGADADRVVATGLVTDVIFDSRDAGACEILERVKTEVHRPGLRAASKAPSPCS